MLLQQRTSAIVALVVWLMVPSFVAAADKSAVGIGRLLTSVSGDAETGKISNVFGEKLNGYLIYAPGGRVSVNLSADGRKPLSGDRFTTPAEERAQAFSTASRTPQPTASHPRVLCIMSRLRRFKIGSALTSSVLSMSLAIR